MNDTTNSAATKKLTVSLLDDVTVEVPSFEIASKRVTDEIVALDLGSSDWYGRGAGVVRLDDEKIARVSYNGRIWNLDGTERTS